MEILAKDVREATKARFDAELQNPVKLVHFTQEPGRLVLLGSLQGQDCFFCKEARQLLEEVAALSDKITLEVLDIKSEKERAAQFGIDKVPGLVIMGEEDYGIRIYGIPSGYEYTTLVEDIVDVSRRQTKLSEKTKEALKTVNQALRIQVFITPTCAYCPETVHLAHQFALESPLIRAEMIESTEFPQLSDRYNVRGVPKTIVNDLVSFEGAVPEEEFLENVLRALK